MKASNYILIGAVMLAGLAFPTLVPNQYYVHLVLVVAIYAILLFGLDVLVGYTGEVSLGHAGLFGIGAYVTGIAATNLSLPFIIGIPAAIIITTLLGAVLAYAALRVTGPYLAMVTLAFGTIVLILINEMDFLTGGPMGLMISKPSIFGHQMTGTEFYYFVILMLSLSMLVVSRLLESHVGRAFEALRGSPIASDCMGVSVYKYKVFAFVVSSAYAGFAGALFAYSEEYIAPNGFGIDLAIIFLLGLILGGRKSRAGALIGAAVVVFLPNILFNLQLVRTLTLILAGGVVIAAGLSLLRSGTPVRKVILPVIVVAAFTVFTFSIDDLIEHRLTIFGLLILAAVYYLPEGLVGFAVTLAERMGFKSQAHAEADLTPGTEEETWGRRPAGAAGPVLEARGIVMAFGGLKALDGVDLVVERGTIHGLIGPNGSGKSTFMNVLTGVYSPTSGTIAFLGQEIGGKAPAEIARLGIARTFQNAQLFGQMTVLENVLVGLHHTFDSNAVDPILHTPRYRREKQAALRRASGILDFVGLRSLANSEARNLPYGKQRVLEIARALALSPQLILLDEPAAGLTAPDIEELVRMIRKMRDHGLTVILIEHHMDVVMSICNRVTVLDFGQKIAEGDAAYVRNHPKVIEAYLGGGMVDPDFKEASNA